MTEIFCSFCGRSNKESDATLALPPIKLRWGDKYRVAICLNCANISVKILMYARDRNANRELTNYYWRLLNDLRERMEEETAE